jgi:hypothetical protein
MSKGPINLYQPFAFPGFTSESPLHGGNSGAFPEMALSSSLFRLPPLAGPREILWPLTIPGAIQPSPRLDLSTIFFSSYLWKGILHER